MQTSGDSEPEPRTGSQYPKDVGLLLGMPAHEIYPDIAMAILRDGHIGNQHFLASTPVLAPPPPTPVPPEEPSILGDRVFWVTVLRPQLIAAGNLIETDEHRKELAAVKRQLVRESKQAKALPAAKIQDAKIIGIKLADGTWVGPDYRAEGEVDPEPVRQTIPEIKDSGCPF